MRPRRTSVRLSPRNSARASNPVIGVDTNHLDFKRYEVKTAGANRRRSISNTLHVNPQQFFYDKKSLGDL